MQRILDLDVTLHMKWIVDNQQIRLRNELTLFSNL
jgi:hypothetical protein